MNSFKKDLERITESIPNVGDGKVGIVEFEGKVIKLVCIRTDEGIVICASILDGKKEVEVKLMSMTFDVLAEVIGGERNDGEKHIVLLKGIENG